MDLTNTQKPEIDLTDAQKPVAMYLLIEGFMQRIIVEIFRQLKIENSDEFSQLSDEQINRLTDPIKPVHKRSLIEARNDYNNDNTGRRLNMNVNPYYVCFS